MYFTRFIFTFVICLLSCQVTMAQSSVDSPKQIDIPVGHTLIEVPATFMTTRDAILHKADTQPIFVPPTYETVVKNGIKVRREISPARKVERTIMTPFETRVRRMVKHPISYNLTNEKGQVIKRWRWINGELTEIK